MYKVNVGQQEFEVKFKANDFDSGTLNGQPFQLDTFEANPRTFHLIWDDHSYQVEIGRVDTQEKWINMKINGQIYHAQLQDDMDLLLRQLGMTDAAGPKLDELRSPMPGMVREVYVEPGQAVHKGDKLLVLEAMKMENVIKSPGDGTIKLVTCAKGLPVEKNQVLITFA